jgi:outer membrane protein OmpA-like peptidoglycan-associated protein
MFSKRLAIWFFMLLSGMVGHGAYANVTEGVFPDARVIFEFEKKEGPYSLALGPLQKVNNQWRAERERRVQGEVERRTLEMPERYSVEEVQDQLHDALRRRGARPLYTCQGLDCGSSNAWANIYFDIKQLYGLDQHQYYGVWELKTEEGDLYYLVTYVVQRGNRRIYAQLDQIRAPLAEAGTVVASPATLVNSLREQGFFVLTGVEWSAGGVRVEPDHLKAVVNALQRDPWLNVYIVGHDYGPGGHEQQLERSKKAAQQVSKSLIEAGVKAARVSAHGVGGLAPARRQGERRVEVVLQ